ncbi:MULTISPECIES: hypothetical protein [Myxococcus]|uniref:hypothetical protein n=1 Tax=Myxococcus TaxID=32 RepID=UPI001E5BF48D|nr:MULTISPECIES: hypothetical protein [Myxococcus]
MADGTLAPVESVELGDKVIADAKGTVLTVTDVARGNEAKPLFRLQVSPLNRLPKAWHTDFRNGVRSTQAR